MWHKHKDAFLKKINRDNLLIAIYVFLVVASAGAVRIATSGKSDFLSKNEKNKPEINKEYVKKDSDGYKAYLDSFYVEQNKSDSVFYVDKQAKLDALDNCYSEAFSKYTNKVNILTDSIFKYMNFEETARTNSDSVLLRKSIEKQDYFFKQWGQSRDKYWKKFEKYQKREDSIMATSPIHKGPLSKEAWLVSRGVRGK